MVLVREQYCLSNSDDEGVRIRHCKRREGKGREGVGLILFLFSV